MVLQMTGRLQFTLQMMEQARQESAGYECWLFEDNLQYLLLRDYLILLKHVN